MSGLKYIKTKHGNKGDNMERTLSIFVNNVKIFEYTRKPEDFNKKDVAFLITDKKPGDKKSLLVSKYHIK